jgi:hypothetical protein
MNKTLKLRALMGLLTIICAGTAQAAESISTNKDLTAVIALQGLPCGQVIGAVKQGANDYLASCQDTSRYRVYINTDGRVVVEKQ